MANLLGQNIGTNYKGILNLNTLNGNLTTTLEAITDGDGNASTLLLSTTLARVSSNLTIGGSTTASAMLHVRGDGTNNIARFENSAGTDAITILSNGAAISSTFTSSPQITFGTRSLTFNFNATSASNNAFTISTGTFSPSSNISQGVLNISTSFGATSATNSSFRPINLTYAINNTAAQTGTATGIFLNATETALNGMGHNLMDLQRGGVSQFVVSRDGSISASTITSTGTWVQALTFRFGNFGTRMRDTSDGRIALYNNAENNFDRLQLGGTTNAFPAIKRNGAAINFVLADDSALANINTGQINVDNFSLVVQSTIAYFQYNLLVGASGLNNISAALEVRSTTKGFLPPRMTTAQINAIATPAEGLVVFNTTISHLCVYQAGAWVKLSHSPM